MAPLAHPIVVIDPGHGGYDPGTSRGDVREKDITLHIGLHLRNILTRAGFRVVMTRETDTSPGGYTNVAVDLKERVRIANAAGATIVFSIHVNAGGGHGAEIFVHEDGGNIRPLAKAIITNVGAVMGTHGKAIKASYEAPEGGLALVDDTNDPAMLLEIGFIDSDDLQKIQAHINWFAPQIAQGFCSFYGVAYPDAPVAVPSLDRGAAQEAAEELSRLFAVATPAAQLAYNFAANAARKAAGIPITTDLGKPSADTAQHVIKIVHELWHQTERVTLRVVYAHMADVLRDATGCQ